MLRPGGRVSTPRLGGAVCSRIRQEASSGRRGMMEGWRDMKPQITWTRSQRPSSTLRTSASTPSEIEPWEYVHPRWLL